ncbi:MAG: radical SAM protein, partial [bacterium]
MCPAYLESYHSGKFARVIEEAFTLLESCSICPRRCGINRIKGELGFCKTGLKPRVYSFMPHQGEEPPISGVLGSGAIFFSGCNMRCCYCQNYEFSQEGGGREVGDEELADIMLK